MKNVRISVVLLAAILFIFAGEASALFDNKIKEVSKKLEETEASRAILVKEMSALQEKCAALERDNAALKEDRSNFLVRIKQLMDERNQSKPAAEAVREIESLKRELVELQKTVREPRGSPAAAGGYKEAGKPDEEKEALKRENLALEKDVASLKSGMPSDKRSERLEEELEFLKKENLALKKEMASLREKGPDLPDAGAVEEKTKELRKELLSRQKESAKLHSELARLEKENDSLGASKKEADSLKKENSKASAERKHDKDLLSQAVKEKDTVIKEKDAVIKDKDALAAELKQYKKNYAEAVKRNKAFERDIKNMPKKFSELARQNIAMRKETSEMHYNLGVFYAKNKEYERAVNEFKKTVDIDPEHAYAYFNLGYINAEYMVNRKEAIANFRHYLNLAKSDDKDAEWAKKYILTWQTWEGKQSID